MERVFNPEILAFCGRAPLRAAAAEGSRIGNYVGQGGNHQRVGRILRSDGVSWLGSGGRVGSSGDGEI